MKRLIIATLLGLVFGFVCLSLAKSGVYEISTALAVSIVSGRVLIGFAIGISKFSFKHWSIHGLVMGLIVSLPAGFGAMIGPENPEFTHKMLFLSTVITGMIYGFLIELITSAIFKAKQ
ncbi:MAG: hypothetical protein HN952_06485 [Candidatus Cloacimonetes bacterium]|jgi:hypothetical protein|nr:hypothetical protein [Candidatus Cloacimonadota bacterium]MBT6994582.1 hypothetical protein [Candidatus Cloacimonadota bacterium]MBT7470129.1 hypothetical protein [Candidatus Cloacimonadota bacterium]